jgi:hypothetical protein
MGGTVRTAIEPTSLPNASIDPALRRVLAPTSRLVRKAAARGGGDPAAVGSAFVATLAAGTDAVDPAAFVPAGVAPPVDRDPRPARAGMLDLGPLGVPALRPADGLEGAIAELRAEPPPSAEQRMRFRADLRVTGLVTGRHVAALRSLAVGFGDAVPALVAAAADQPGAAALAGELDADAARVRFDAVDVSRRGEIVVRAREAGGVRILGRVEGAAPAGTLARLPPDALRGRGPMVVRPGAVEGDVVVVDDGAPTAGGASDAGRIGSPTIVPPLVRDAAVVSRFERAGSLQWQVAAVADVRPGTEVVPFPLDAAATALARRCSPSVAHVARVGTMVRLGETPLGALLDGAQVAGVATSPLADRVMAYPELTAPAYRMLADHDRDRVVPGVDAIPPDSVTLLETNPRFVAAYMAGANHELNRELLWRRGPIDQRGTPIARFWDRLDGAPDIPPMHRWESEGQLAAQVGGESNLVLLLRGELLRMYPGTAVLAIRAIGPDTPGDADADVREPIFSGHLEPDIAFFGFDLVDDDLASGHGWFFALQEQVTEPRFGFDEAVDSRRLGGPLAWREVAWPDAGVADGERLAFDRLRSLASSHRLTPVPANAADAAEALFQEPVQVLVHASDLTGVGGT